MAETRDLLIEIGTEELPPKSLQRLADAFLTGIRKRLTEAGLASTGMQNFATPRRLAVLIRDLYVVQKDQESIRRGPALKAAYDDSGNPTRPAEGFARSCGVSVEDLERLETDKGSWLAFRSVQRGKPAAELLPEIIESALKSLPVQKRMRWGAGDVEFVRPVHWVVLLFGNEVIEAEIMGISAGRHTRGHRFHHPDSIALDSPADYATSLQNRGRVLADFNERRDSIRQQIVNIGRDLGGTTQIEEDLLNEVTALVEWPVALPGSFDERFLDIPAEALISSMQEHQKYFPILDSDKRLLPHFIAVSNIDSLDPEQVRIGNERVIRPRLADAAFFWEQDRKQTLASRVDRLRHVVFQDKLGSLADKQLRIGELASSIADQTGGDPQNARRASALSKCDLMTSMVYEFPELQGIMGRYYAQLDGENEEVALSLDEQYQPRFAGDELPSTRTGQALAIADRLDTLVGIFAIGQPPSGDKDPFALRRSALGVLRIMIERQLDLDLDRLLREAARHLPPQLDAESIIDEVLCFALERLRGYYLDSGIKPDVFDAVHSRQPTNPLDFDRRIKAVSEFEQLPESESLAAANKRIRNILRKSGQTVSARVDTGLLLETAEQELATAIAQLAESASPLFEQGNYTRGLYLLAELKQPVDHFFDKVLVMADQEDLRDNRLALLQSLSNLFLQVADISRLQ